MDAVRSSGHALQSVHVFSEEIDNNYFYVNYQLPIYNRVCEDIIPGHSCINIVAKSPCHCVHVSCVYLQSASNRILCNMHVYNYSIPDCSEWDFQLERGLSNDQNMSIFP